MMKLSFQPAIAGHALDPRSLSKKQLLAHVQAAHEELAYRISLHEVYEGEGRAAQSMYEELAGMERDIKRLKNQRWRK